MFYDFTTDTKFLTRMAQEKYPVTPAVRMLREHGVECTHHLYEYEEKGGTAVSARELGVTEHSVSRLWRWKTNEGSRWWC